MSAPSPSEVSLTHQQIAEKECIRGGTAWFWLGLFVAGAVGIVYSLARIPREQIRIDMLSTGWFLVFWALNWTTALAHMVLCGDVARGLHGRSWWSASAQKDLLGSCATASLFTLFGVLISLEGHYEPRFVRTAIIFAILLTSYAIDIRSKMHVARALHALPIETRAARSNGGASAPQAEGERNSAPLPE